MSIDLTMDRSKLIGKPLSECPAGASGCPTMSEEQIMNEVADDGATILQADDVLARIIVPQAYTVPDTLNSLKWVKTFNQGAIGSCNLASGMTLMSGLYFLKSGGERKEFSVFFSYMLCQSMDGLLGRDAGSTPPSFIKMVMKYGALPMDYPGVPPYPKTYGEGLRTHKALWDSFVKETKNPNGQTPILDAMAEHRLKSFIQIKTPDQASKLMKRGVSLFQSSGPWVSGFDKDPERMFLGGDLHGKHGLHAYITADMSPNGADLVPLNSWGSGTGNDSGLQGGGHGWGDESYKSFAMDLARQYYKHRYFTGFMLTDMTFPSTGTGPRKIPYTSSSWG